MGGSLQCKRGILVILWMSLVDVAVGDLVTCMSFVLWVCLRETRVGGGGGRYSEYQRYPVGKEKQQRYPNGHPVPHLITH